MICIRLVVRVCHAVGWGLQAHGQCPPLSAAGSLGTCLMHDKVCAPWLMPVVLWHVLRPLAWVVVMLCHFMRKLDEQERVSTGSCESAWQFHRACPCVSPTWSLLRWSPLARLQLQVC